MSCPDWQRLAARRLVGRRDGEPSEPAAWTAALEHLDDCTACRPRALAADPTLVFRRLAAPEIDAAAEAERMRQAVSAMRRAQRVVDGTGADVPARRRRWTAWRVAATALVAAGLLLATAPADRPRSKAASGPADRTAAPPLYATLPASATDAADALAGLPVFEGLDRPQEAHVYQLDDDGLLVVMIVDETLDV